MTHTTFEQSKRLKAVGYNRPASHYFYYSGATAEDISPSQNWNTQSDYVRFNLCSAPTLSEVADWLREVHGMHVAVNITHDGWYWQVILILTGKCLNESSFIDTHDLSLSAGIDAAITIVEQRKK